MKLDLLLSILDYVELLKVDAQPIRDLIDNLQQGVDLSHLEHLLEVLHILLESKKFNNGSSPSQVIFLLNKLKEIEKSPMKSALTAPTTSESAEIVGLLSELKQEIQSIKTKVNSTSNTITTNSVKEDSVKRNITEPLPVFINPISKDVDIRGNVTIDSKKGDTISDKLTKLKNIKRR